LTIPGDSAPLLQLTEAACLRDLLEGRFPLTEDTALAFETAASLRLEGHQGRVTASAVLTRVARRYGDDRAAGLRQFFADSGAYLWPEA